MQFCLLPILWCGSFLVKFLKWPKEEATSWNRLLHYHTVTRSHGPTKFKSKDLFQVIIWTVKSTLQSWHKKANFTYQTQKKVKLYRTIWNYIQLRLNLHITHKAELSPSIPYFKHTITYIILTSATRLKLHAEVQNSEDAWHGEWIKLKSELRKDPIIHSTFGTTDPAITDIGELIKLKDIKSQLQNNGVWSLKRNPEQISVPENIRNTNILIIPFKNLSPKHKQEIIIKIFLNNMSHQTRLLK